MYTRLRCESTDLGFRCNAPADWWIAGDAITPHPCCTHCKNVWVSRYEGVAAWLWIGEGI